MHKRYCVYILTNRSQTLYVGMTGNLYERVLQHKQKNIPGFTSKYNIDRLVYFEEYGRPDEAILREKQLKGWLRSKKIALIDSANPEWNDLSEEWYSTN
jgi:putative endonuclease